MHTHCSFFEPLVNQYYRLLCRVQSLTMATRLNAAQYVSVTVGFIVVILEFTTSVGNELFELNQLVLLGGFAAILVPTINELFEIHRNNVSYTINSSDSYHADVLAQLQLSDDYKNAGYEKRTYTDCGINELYIDSNETNMFLFDGSFRKDRAIKLQKRRSSFRIPDKVRPLVAAIFRQALHESSNRRLFNGSLLRLNTDILPPNTKEVEVQKAKYFDGLCTHEIVFKRASHSDNTSMNFYGESLLLDEKGEMIELWKSHCANFMGASTMAVTSDRQLLIGIQGDRSMINANRYTPSGSGSVDYKDFSRYESMNGTSPSLQELVAFAAERELREECAIPESVDIRTYVIGYARLLERGGKPDFFCISFIDVCASEIVDHFKERLNLPEYALTNEPKTIEVHNGQTISKALSAYLNDVRAEQPNEHRISIQLQLSCTYIQNLEKLPEWGRVSGTRQC